MKIVTVKQMRSIEQSAVEHGVSLDQLQLNAAHAIAAFVSREAGFTVWPALVLAGPGNNGRDALIAGAILAEGIGDAQDPEWIGSRSVRAYLAPGVKSEDVISRLEAAGAQIVRHDGDGSLSVLRQWVREAEVVVDGLLGIGVRGAAREPIATIIKVVDDECRTSETPVAAVDLPSGIDADTGEVGGPALHASWTLSLGCVKAGLLRYPAAGYVGDLVTLEIGLPSETYEAIPVELSPASAACPLLPARPADANKGTFGRVLAVAGSKDLVGAPFLCGAAAARVGCGLVTLAVPAWQRGALVGILPEATYLPLQEETDAPSAGSNIAAISKLIPDCDALAIGPGLGQGAHARDLVLGVLGEASRRQGLRVVVDADGLNLLSREPEWWTKIPKGCVLTPHPAEMSRLTGLSISEISRSRWEVAREHAMKWGQVVVLKGAFTVIASPDGSARVSDASQPALATAGTGDVLTGLIAGLMAQGMQPGPAAEAGVAVHLEAARLALLGLRRGDDAPAVDRLLASDLLPVIPQAVANLRATPKPS